MNYSSKLDVAKKKWKKFIKIVVAIVCIITVGFIFLSLLVPIGSWKYYVSLPDVSKRKKGELRIHFLDVGQGDSTLMELPDGKILLLDGGNGTSTTSKTILRYLNALKIDTIDYLVVSHADSDHCGGLDVVVENKKIKKAYIPPTYPTVNTQYAELYSALAEEGCEIVPSSMKERFEVSDSEYGYTLAFLYPYSKDVEEEDWSSEETNDVSCVMWLDYGGVSALFTGDVSSAVETELMRGDTLGAFSTLGVELDDTEILKVSHHGSRDATSLKFVQYLNVQTAMISCGKNNPYGHPSKDTLSNLQAVNASVFRTDEQGHLTVTIKDGGYTVKPYKK